MLSLISLGKLGGIGIRRHGRLATWIAIGREGGREWREGRGSDRWRDRGGLGERGGRGGEGREG